MMSYSPESVEEVKKQAQSIVSQIVIQKNKAELVTLLKNQRPRREPDRVRMVTSLDRISHQSCYTKPVKYYFTTGRKVLCPRLVEKERPPYFIDAHLRNNEKVHLDKIQKLPNYLKPSRRDKLVIGLNDRLYIPRTDPDYPSPRTIVKTSPDYYKMIIGRQIEESAFFKKSVYVERLKKTFLIRLQEAISEEAHFVEEETRLRELSSLIYIWESSNIGESNVVPFDASMTLKMKNKSGFMINNEGSSMNQELIKTVNKIIFTSVTNIRNNYIKTINLFNRFLFESMDEQKAVTHTAGAMAKLVELKSVQIKSAGNVLGNIKDSLVSMDNTLQQLRFSKIVLDDFKETKRVESRLAPDYWKRDYTKQKDKLKPIAEKAADYVLQMFAYFKLEVPFPERGLEKLVLRLANTIRNLGPPALYFKKPSEVPLALKKLEHSTIIAINTLNTAYLRTEEVKKDDKEIHREQRKVLNMLRQELDDIKNDFIGRMSQILMVEDETGVIMSYWRAVATNPDLLQAFVQIKCLYDEFIGDEAPTKDIVEMLSMLTDKIISIQLDVNSLPREKTDRMYNELKNRDELAKQYLLVTKKRREEAGRMLKTMKKQYEDRFSHPGLPQQRSTLETEATQEEIKIDISEMPSEEEMLEYVMNTMQPEKYKEHFYKFINEFENLNKIEKGLEEVKYPPVQPKFDKTDVTEPSPSISTAFILKKSAADDLSGLSSSYIASAKATVKECDSSDLSA